MMNTTTLREISLGVDQSGKRSPAAWRTVLGAGAAAATLDLVYACTLVYFLRGMSPQRLLQSIASGIYGQESYAGGWATAAVGFAAHYFILIVAAWWFFLRAQPVQKLIRVEGWLTQSLEVDQAEATVKGRRHGAVLLEDVGERPVRHRLRVTFRAFEARENVRRRDVCIVDRITW